MPITVIATEEFEAWLTSLTPRERREVLHAVRLLQELGLQLSFPYCSAIKGSRHALRELRPKRGSSPLRPIYAFDPLRQAVLLTGGDKGSDKAMYDRIIPVAEAIWDRYLGESS
jgi:hypothetical protein